MTTQYIIPRGGPKTKNKPEIDPNQRVYPFMSVYDYKFSKTPIICTYAINIKPTKEVYVGSTANFRSRWAKHNQMLRGQMHKNENLQKKFDTYGPDALEIEILSIHDNTDDLLLFEEISASHYKQSQLLNFRIGFWFKEGWNAWEGDGSKRYIPKNPRGRISKRRWFDHIGA